MTAPPLPLEGCTVVGVEHSVAGPLCTRILSDLGARTIKIERAPHGDFARHWDGHVGGECSQFWWLNRGKESVVLDLKDATGRAALDALLERADVLVYNLSPAAADRLGLGAEQLSARHPKLVSCQITGYGATGAFRDRKAYDMLMQAEAGVMSLTGTPEQPARAGVSISDVGTGIYAATLVLGGLFGRMRDGRGRHLDVAMYDATVEFAAPMLISYLNAGVVYPRLPDRHHAIAPYGVFHCADGRSVLVAVEHDSDWRVFAEAVLDRPELADDPRCATNAMRLVNRGEVDDAVAAALARLSLDEATALFDELGLAYAALNDMEQVSRHPVVADRAMLADVPIGSDGRARTIVGLGERLFGPTDGAQARPPELGEHTEAVLEELGLAERPRVAAAES